MNFDLRLPIGIMFSLFGALLVIFGAVSGKEIYDTHSLGININLIWGAVLLVFGAFMLLLTWRASRKPRPGEGSKTSRRDETGGSSFQLRQAARRHGRRALHADQRHVA